MSPPMRYLFFEMVGRIPEGSKLIILLPLVGHGRLGERCSQPSASCWTLRCWYITYQIGRHQSDHPAATLREAQLAGCQTLCAYCVTLH
jgi:hypothetical protein